MKNSPPYPKDFPDYLPCSLTKELRQGTKSIGFVITLVAYPLVLAFFITLGFFRDAKGEVVLDAEVVSVLVWGGLLMSLLLLIPTSALFGVKSEIQSRNIDLLVLTKLRANNIAWGKWLSLMAQAFLVIVITMPFLLLRYYYGDINILGELTMLLLIWMLAGICYACCIWVAGLPLFFSIATIIGMVIGSFICLIIIIEDNIGRDFIQDLSSAEYWGILVGCTCFSALVMRIFLLLAVRWYAPVAENISSKLRATLLIPAVFVTGWQVLSFLSTDILPVILPSVKIFHIPSITDVLTHSFISVFIIFSSYCLTALIMAYEFTGNTPFLPIHVTQIKKGRLKLWKRVFCLPSWHSTCCYLTLLCALFFCSSMQYGDSDKVTASFARLAEHGILCLHIIYSILLVSFFIRMLKHEGVQSFRPFICIATGFLCWIIGVVVSQISPTVFGALLIPLGHLNHYASITVHNHTLEATIPTGAMLLVVITLWYLGVKKERHIYQEAKLENAEEK